MQNKQPFIARFAPLLVAVFWGCAFVWIKMGLEGFSSATLVTLRFALAALGFVALYTLRIISFQGIQWRDIPRFFLLVASGVFVYHLSLVTAETVLPASVASLIGQTTALFALAFSAVGQPSVLRGRTLIGTLLAAAGAVLVISANELPTGDIIPLLPVAICFGAPISLAVYTLLGKAMVQRYGAANLTAQVCIVGGAILAAAGIFRPAMLQEMANAPRSAWIAVGSLALFSTVAAYILWYQALAYRSASQLSMYTYLVPVFGVSVASIVLGEHIPAALLIGGAAVIGGIYLSNSAPRPAATASSSAPPPAKVLSE
jgi:drug/metabolite transporter (DMT)-like permease